MFALKKMRHVTAITGGAAVLMLGGLAAASPASADTNISCTEWNDSQTVGYSCYGDANEFIARAICWDDSTQFGTWEPVNSGESSYAYCAGHGGLQSSGIDWY